MLSRQLTRRQTGARRLQQPQGVVSSTCASKLRLGPLKLPGSCQRWTARSRATSWNGTNNGFYSNNQDVNSYLAGTTAAAGAAGSNSSGPATAGTASWPSSTPSSFTPSPGSTWEEESSSSGWQDYQGADWGTTTLPGDWGEAGSNTAAAAAAAAAQPDTANQQQQQIGQQYGYAAAGSSGFSSSFDQQQQQQASDGRWPFADSTFQQQQQQQQPGGAGGVRSPVLPSDITLLGRRDADSMLPLFPSPDQARFYQPRTVPERLVQVLGSFGLSVALSKSAVLAGPALLFPIWGPWVRAGVRNVQMYLRQFTCVGLWRSEMLGVRVNTVPYAYRDPTGTLGDTVTVTVGDPWQGGAATELTFPYQAGCEDIVEGEPAELLVLSQEDTFYNFKVVREVYLPQSGMWLSEYPFVDREMFLDVSLAIERGRQAATGTAPTGGTTPPNPPSSSSAAGVQQPYRPAPMYTPPGFAPTGFATGPGAAAAGYSGAPGFMPAVGFSDQPAAGSGLRYAAGSPAVYAAAASGGVAYSSMPFTTASQPSWGYPGVGVGAAAASSPPYQAGYGSPYPSGAGQGLMDSAAAAAAGQHGAAEADGSSDGSSSSDSSSREGMNTAAAGASSNGHHRTATDAAGDQQQGSSSSSSWGDNVTDGSSSAAWSAGAAGGSSHVQYNSSTIGQAGSKPSSNGSSSGVGSWHFDGQAASQSSMDAAGMPGYISSSSSGGGYGSSSGLPSPATFAMDLVEDVADAATGVVSNVAGAATGVAAGVAGAATGVVSNVAGAATGVAAGVADAATGVAASVAAGFGGWFTAASDGSSSSGGDTAVVPDVIIEGPGTYWSPGGYGAGSSAGYYGSSAYGSNGYMDSRPWAQQQQQQQPGAGFGPMYSGNDPAAAAGYGGRWYEGYAGYSQGAASPGGFSGWSSSRGYGDPAYPGNGASSSAGGSPFPGQGAAGYAGYSSGPAAANPYGWSGPSGGADSTFTGSNPDAASGTQQQQQQNTGTWRVDSATTAAGFDSSNSSSPQQQPRA